MFYFTCDIVSLIMYNYLSTLCIVLVANVTRHWNVSSILYFFYYRNKPFLFMLEDHKTCFSAYTL